MADSQDSTRREPPLRRKAYTDEICYTGSRAQLLEAEIIGPDDPLPGDPGQLRTCVRYPDDNPRRIRIVIARPAGRFTVRITRPLEEIEAECQAYELNIARGRFEEMRRRLQERIDGLPKSHEAFREVREYSLRLVQGAADVLLKPEGGYSFDSDTADNVRVLVGAIRQTIAEGRTQFRRADLEAQIAEIRAQARSADPDFARFMDLAQSRPTLRVVK